MVVFDIACKCKNGVSFIIEMQKGYQKYFKERALYYTLNDSASMDHWEAVSQYENGKMYQYHYGLDEYMIFYLEDEFYVYHEYSSDMESEEFTGRFSTADEVNKAIDR